MRRLAFLPLLALPLLMAPTGGYPTNPQFQTAKITGGVNATANSSSTSAIFAQQFGAGAALSIVNSGGGVGIYVGTGVSQFRDIQGTGTLTQTGPASISGNATVGGTFGVTGASTLGTVSSGAATLASAAVTGNATVGGTLGVTGAATLASSTTIAGVRVPVTKVKAATTTRTSTTTKTADPDLAYTLPVAGTYLIHIAASYQQNNAGTQGFQWKISNTGTSTSGDFAGYYTSSGAFTKVQAAVPITYCATTTINVGTGIYAAAAQTTDSLSVDCTLFVTVAGTVSFDWAQSVSNAGATSLMVGSTMTVTQLN